MEEPITKENILNIRFISLCGVTFLALCNVSVFFNFHEYLLGLEFGNEQAGFLVGLYSLSAMALYATVSQRITLDNAYRTMLLGIALVFLCAVSYRFAEGFLPLASVRSLNGAGVFCIMAACMVILVSIIPDSKSGTAFSIYSVALLAPYSVMPAVSEFVRPWLDTPTMLYMLTGCLLIPATILAYAAKPEKQNNVEGGADKKDTSSVSNTMRMRNLRRKPIAAILLVNGVYFTLFSGLFYLFEGFALSRGVGNPGFFFTVQMGVMVAIRLFGGHIFDSISKVLLVTLSMGITGLGFILLFYMPSPAWSLFIAVVFGLGMGLCIPPLNSLMYLVAEPKFRGYNANMMMLTVHFGTFAGPFVGSLLIDAGGYSSFLLTATFLTICGAVFFLKTNPEKQIKRKKNRLSNAALPT